MEANELNLARAAGSVAGVAGSDATSCPWAIGELRDAWLSAYYDAVGVPLHKVLDAGGPLVSVPRDDEFKTWLCPKCFHVLATRSIPKCLSNGSDITCPMVIA